MKSNIAELSRRIGSLLEQRGFELVDVRLLPRGRSACLQVFIDHLDGHAPVTVGDCAQVSKALAADQEIDGLLPPQHSLEVSSPGVDRPLTRPAHFRRFRGEAAVVRLRVARDGRRTFRGTIAEADDEKVVLVADGEERVEIAHAEILSAQLKVDPWKPREKR